MIVYTLRESACGPELLGIFSTREKARMYAIDLVSRNGMELKTEGESVVLGITRGNFPFVVLEFTIDAYVVDQEGNIG